MTLFTLDVPPWRVQGEDVFPIPGTKRIQYLEENVAAFHVKLTAEDKQQLEAVFAADQVSPCTSTGHFHHCFSWFDLPSSIGLLCPSFFLLGVLACSHI